MSDAPNSFVLVAQQKGPDSTFRSRAFGALKKLTGSSAPSDILEQREFRAVARHQLGGRITDEALAERARSRSEEEAIERQYNREKIAEHAADLLEASGADAPEDASAQPELDPDWLNVFTSFAEKASGPALQEIWARVLAEQIRTPGAVSLRTLQFASTLDKPTATAVQAMASWVYDNKNMPKMATEHLPFETLHILKDVGLIGSMDSDVRAIVTFTGGFAGFEFGDIGVLIKGEAGQTLDIPGLSVSRIARELLTTITLNRDPAAPIAFGEWCKAQAVVTHVQVGPIRRTPSGYEQPVATLFSKWERPSSTAASDLQDA